MVRRITLALFLLFCLAPSAWPKFKEEDQRYLDDQFKTVLNQVQALAAQVTALNAQLAEIKQNEIELQSAVIRQQHQLKEVDDMLASMRLGNDDSFAKLKAAIADAREKTEAAIAKLASQPSAPPPPTAVTPPPASPPGRPAPQGYITAVGSGGTVMIDMGSAQGLQQGSRLAIYRASDPNTRIGTIEITQVIDAGNARARVLNMNAGLSPEFSDLVRAE